MRLFGFIFLGVLSISGTAFSQVLYEDATASTMIDFVHHAGPVSGDRPASDFGHGAAASDYDGDGDPDIYIVDALNFPNKLYRNNGDGTFAEVGVAAGVADTGYGQMALFLDLDNNGWDDLIVINSGTATSKLFRNNGDGTFTDITAGSGFTPDELIFGGVGAGDFDKDGDLDVSVVGWNNGTSFFYRNDGNFQFVEVGEATGAKPVRSEFDGAYQWSVVHVDLDNDGWQDIISAVDFSANYVMRNNGDGSFTEVTTAVNMDHTSNDMGLAIGDVDNDLDLDVYITNITGSGSSNCFFPVVQGGCNTLNINNGSGVFTDVAGDEGMDDTEWGWGTWFFDADLDGDKDLYAVNGFDVFLGSTAPAYFFRNDGGSWTSAAAAANLDYDDDSKALLPIDYDMDGDIDLLITNTYGAIHMLRNVSPRNGKHWLTVRPVGADSPRNGVGARVYVTADGVTQMHEIFAGGSFLAGPLMEAHFGLGTATVATEVRVEFPRGRVITLNDVPADQYLSVGALKEVEDLNVEHLGAGVGRLTWAPVPGAEVYSLSRGNLASIGATDLGACLASMLTVANFDDSDSLVPGETYFYLARAETLLGETGPLGPGDGGVERTNSNPSACP